MSDTISKSALLGWLDVYIDLSSGNDPVHKSYRRAYQHVKRAIERGTFDTDCWISVKDRLPENYNDVLVYITTNGERKHITTGYFHDYWTLHRKNSGFEVTHWMHLPGVPKENESG